MTKISPLFSGADRESFLEKRKEMLVIMAETSRNPANICPEKQEELASFMVAALNGFADLPPSVPTSTKNERDSNRPTQ